MEEVGSAWWVFLDSENTILPILLRLLPWGAEKRGVKLENLIRGGHLSPNLA